MKVVFVNPPVVRSKHSCANNNFKFEGILPQKKYRKLGIVYRLINRFNKTKGARFGVRAGSRWPWTMNIPIGGNCYPFFLGYAAANAKAHGYDVVLIDSVAEEEYSYESFLEKLRRENPEIVVLETSTPTIDIDLWLAEKISHFAEVCLAGSHVTENAEKVLEENSFVRYVLKGEYALNCITMLQTRRKGIYECEPIDNLDVLPFPFRDYKCSADYYDPTIFQSRPELQIYASKGCPFKCIYCMWPQVMYNGKYTPRNPEKVAEEIKTMVEKHGYKSIFFDDDTFNIGDERISLLCDKLKEIGLPWSMMGRLDTSPKWLFDKMVDSGCIGMRFGVETFDSKVLKNIKKGLVRDSVLETLEYISKRHPQLMIHLTMMKNLPGQTEEIHQNDMKLLQNLGYSFSNQYRNYQLSSCVPFPGTELYRNLKEMDINLDDWKKYDGFQQTIMGENK